MSLSLRTMAACALATAAMLAAPAQAFVYKGYHIMPTPSYAAKMAKIGRAPHVDAGEVINYYGGSVFTGVRVVNVIWGPNVSQTIVSTVPGLAAALPVSTYLDQGGKECSTKGVKTINGHKGTNQKIGRGTYFGQVQITPKNSGTNLSDDDVQKEIKYQIKKGILPARDLNTLYMIYFPSSVSINLDGLVSCQDFGAYHFATNDSKLSKKNIFYAVEPDCNAGINFITFAASHEFMEATTDNVPTPGSFPDFPQAWNDSSGYEIADVCSGSGTLTSGSGHWTVTQYFLNSTHNCSTGNYTSP